MTADSANLAPPGVTVFCDPPLRSAITALDFITRQQLGASTAVLCAPAPLMLAQIQRHTRNDVLFTLATAMDSAAQLQIIKPATRIGGFSNLLVLAAAVGGYSGQFVPSQLSGARIAVTDNTIMSGFDGAAILSANLTIPVTARLIGAASTADIAFMLTTGEADYGVLYQTDVKYYPALQAVMPLIAPGALTSFSAAVNAAAISSSAQGLLNLMRSQAGAAILQSAGLEIAA